ncbi:hypothetical protein M0R45_002631 [Rubus argutus]|uniref:Uncharacterized protein n=1 Tax=Rubus argutus TaxID=59490 RepID=A0AAW1VSL5_RUBAR
MELNHIQPSRPSTQIISHLPSIYLCPHKHLQYHYQSISPKPWLTRTVPIPSPPCSPFNLTSTSSPKSFTFTASQSLPSINPKHRDLQTQAAARAQSEIHHWVTPLSQAPALINSS